MTKIVTESDDYDTDDDGVEPWALMTKIFKDRNYKTLGYSDDGGNKGNNNDDENKRIASKNR